MEDKNKKDILLPFSILIAAVLIAGSVIYTAGTGGSRGEALLGDNSGAPLPTPGGKAPEIGDSVVLGDKDAPVTFVEYGDYQCPFCGRIFTNVEPQLRKEYIDTGKVKMVYKNFAFLGPESIAAAEASECAKDYGKFWLYHDALFEAEIADGVEHNGNLDKAFFLSIADNLGIDKASFEQCIDSRKYKDKIERDVEQGRSLGVAGTPAIFINDVFIAGAQDYSVFKKAIDNLLNKE